MSAERTPRGLGDPNRPNRLINAALSIMLTEGIQNLSHRAVAAKADVPLGSTTYYFRDLDALLKAAIERLIDQTQQQFDEWSRQVSSAGALPEKLADLIFDRLTNERDQAALSYELYSLAMRRPIFRELSNRWMQVLFDAIQRHTDAQTASVLVTLIDGLMVQGLTLSGSVSRVTILAAIERVAYTPGPSSTVATN